MISQEEWQGILEGAYQGDIQFNEPMKNHTSLAIGGPADVMVTPDEPLSLRNMAIILKNKSLPFLPFGGGTNTVVSDNGIEGAVISLKAFRRIEVLKEGNQHVELFVEAGVQLQRLVNFCKENGKSRDSQNSKKLHADLTVLFLARQRERIEACR